MHGEESKQPKDQQAPKEQSRQQGSKGLASKNPRASSGSRSTSPTKKATTAAFAASVDSRLRPDPIRSPASEFEYASLCKTHAGHR